MPLRYAVSPLVASTARPHPYLLYAPFLLEPAASPSWRQPQKQPFHSSARLRDKQIDNSQNHYETLKLQPGATPAEIKKSFYALSKTHHPDHNPSNPHASRRFMRISEAYSVLSIPAKRAAYDRDTLRLHASSPHHHHSPHAHRHGSYSSTTTSNPAGGRPASGLSRRRTAFQGPPPSFFRSGGWGSQSTKRRAAHEESTGTGFSASSSTSSSAGAGSSTTTGTGANMGGANTGGMGPGQSPFGHGTAVPHFDREAHERTGRHIDRRRAARRAHADEVGVEAERGMAGMFFVIGGVLMVSILGPFAISRIWRGSGGGGGGDGSQDRKSRKSSTTR